MNNKLIVSNNNNLNKTFCGIDLFKLIAAVLVVFIHADEAKNEMITNVVTNCFSGMAVPFFFIVSGFFFEKGLSKLLFLYLFWQIVNLPGNIFIYVSKYPDASVLKYILLLFRSIFLCGNGVVWYILAMCEAAAVIYFLHKISAQKCLCVLIFAGLLLLLGYDAFSEILSGTAYSYINKGFYVVFSWSNNFIMKAVPFMGIGYLISAKGLKSSFKISLLIFALISVFSVLVYLFDLKSIVNFDVNIILNIPLSILFFLMAVSINFNISAKKSIAMRELSSSIYFLHTYFIYNLMDRFFGVEFSSIIKVLVALGGSIIAYIIVKKTNIRLFKFALNISK